MKRITFLKVNIVLLWDQKLVDKVLQPIPIPNRKGQGLSEWFKDWASKGSGHGGEEGLVKGVQANAQFE